MNTRGATLIEAMLSIFIIGILVAALAAALVATSRALNTESLRRDVAANAALGIEIMRRTAANATAIVSSQAINGTTYQSSSSTLVLALPSLNAAGDLIASSTDYVAFARSPSDRTKLRRDLQAAPGSARPSRTDTIASLIDTLVFYYHATSAAAAGRLEAVVIASSTTRGRTFTNRTSSVMTLINH